MNWKAPLAIIILLSSTSVPATIAVNPTDNDAGSDRDAGDREELALPIETGTHEATLAPPYDRIDWFTFEAEEGQRLEFGIETWDNVTFVELYGPGGDPHFDLPPGNVSHVVSETGSWTVQFRHSNSDPWPANYRFSIELHEPQQRIVDHVSAGGTVFEASWEGTLDLSLTVLGCVSRGPSLLKRGSNLKRRDPVPEMGKPILIIRELGQRKRCLVRISSGGLRAEAAAR